MRKYKRVVPMVTPTSSFHRLTKFLLFSFQKPDRKLVEAILLQREKGLKDELHKLEQEAQQTENDLTMELNFSRENYENDLKRERDIFQSKLSSGEMEWGKLEKKLRRESDERVEVCNEKLKVLEEVLVKREEELEDEVEKREAREKEFEGEICEFEKRIEVCNEKLKMVEEILVKREKELEDEVDEREVREKEWKLELDWFKNKLFLAEMEKLELGEKGKDYEGRIKELEGENQELKKKIELSNETWGKKYEGRIEELEGENRELKKKIELSNETLGKEFAMVEERLAKLKRVFGSVGSGEADRGSGNGVGRAVSMTDSHDKASNLESFLVKSQSSAGDPLFKAPPKVERRGSEGITIGVQLEVKTESSFLEYEAEGGGCSEKDINCKRKRSIDETKGDKDSRVVNEKIECLQESGCKKKSHPVSFSTHGISKASSPPIFSSTCINQCKDKNGRKENPELVFTKSISGVVDVTNRCSRGDAHEATPENKAVVGFQSGKGIEWNHKGDMLSAFGEWRI